MVKGGNCFKITLNKHGSDTDDYRTPWWRFSKLFGFRSVKQQFCCYWSWVRARARAHLRIYLGTCDFKLQRPPSAAVDALPHRYVIPRCAAPYVPDRSPRSISASSAISWTRLVNGDENRQFVNLPNGNHHCTKVEGRVCVKSDNSHPVGDAISFDSLGYLSTVGKRGIALIDFRILLAEERCVRNMMARDWVRWPGGRSLVYTAYNLYIIYRDTDVFDIFHRSS